MPEEIGPLRHYKRLAVQGGGAGPLASRGVTGPEGSVRGLFKNEIESAGNPEEFRRQKKGEFRHAMSGPDTSAAIEEVDEVIEPRETRKCLITALELIANKSEVRHYRKHGIMPV